MTPIIIFCTEIFHFHNNHIYINYFQLKFLGIQSRMITLNHQGVERNRRHMRAILTPSRAREIFGLKFAHGGASQHSASTSLAAKYQVSSKTIRDIWNGRSWLEATFDLWEEDRRPPRRILGRPKGKKDSKPRQQKLKLPTDAMQACFDDPEIKLSSTLEIIDNRIRVTSSSSLERQDQNHAWCSDFMLAPMRNLGKCESLSSSMGLGSMSTLSELQYQSSPAVFSALLKPFSPRWDLCHCPLPYPLPSIRSTNPGHPNPTEAGPPGLSLSPASEAMPLPAAARSRELPGADPLPTRVPSLLGSPLGLPGPRHCPGLRVLPPPTTGPQLDQAPANLFAQAHAAILQAASTPSGAGPRWATQDGAERVRISGAVGCPFRRL